MTSYYFLLLSLFITVTKQQQINLKPLGFGSYLKCIPTYNSDNYKHQHNGNFFLTNFLSKNKPVLFTDTLQLHDSNLWTDGGLLHKIPDYGLTVDLCKKENRSCASDDVTMKEFLARYDRERMYLVDVLPPVLQQNFQLPPSLECQEILNKIQDLVWWFSGGSTESLLHYDNVENLYCQVDGHKRWLLAEPFLDAVTIDNVQGHYSNVDVLSVDTTLYEGMENINWIHIITNPGDCIYIPVNWWHQVSSLPGRNMAVNIWWAPSTSNMTSQCTPSSSEEKKFLSDLKFEPGEWFRYMLTDMLLKSSNSSKMTYDDVTVSVVHEHTGEQLIGEKEFEILDVNRNGIFELEEISRLSPHLIHKAVKYSEIGALVISKTED